MCTSRPWIHEIPDPDRTQERHPTGKPRHDVGVAPRRRTHVTRLVQPPHEDPAVDLAAPVDVGGCGKEPQGRAMSARLAVPVLRRDQGFDLLAQLHSPARFGLGGPQHRPRRIPLRHLDGAPVVIDRDKDHPALEGVLDTTAPGVARGHIDDDRHARSSGQHELGRHLDEIPDLDRPVEVDVPDVGRHAVTPRPACGTGEPGLVDPLKDAPAAHRAALTGIRGRREEAQGDLTGGGGGRHTGSVCRAPARDCGA